MQPPSNTLSERIRAQAAELLSLADAIDQYSGGQGPHENGEAGSPAALAPPDQPPRAEDYSDLMPDPPDDPAGWRGAVLRRFRNTIKHG